MNALQEIKNLIQIEPIVNDRPVYFMVINHHFIAKDTMKADILIPQLLLGAGNLTLHGAAH